MLYANFLSIQKFLQENGKLTTIYLMLTLLIYDIEGLSS